MPFLLISHSSEFVLLNKDVVLFQILLYSCSFTFQHFMQMTKNWRHYETVRLIDVNALVFLQFHVVQHIPKDKLTIVIFLFLWRYIPHVLCIILFMGFFQWSALLLICLEILQILIHTMSPCLFLCPIGTYAYHFLVRSLLFTKDRPKVLYIFGNLISRASR